MGNVVTLRRDDDELRPSRPLVTPGDYTVVYVGHAGITCFRVAKIRIDFQLLEHPGIILPRWYRVTGYKSRICAPEHSDIVREVSAALGRVRHDRIPVASLANVILAARVKTVVEDRDQDELAPVNQYSVIAKIKGMA